MPTKPIVISVMTVEVSNDDIFGLWLAPSIDDCVVEVNERNVEIAKELCIPTSVFETLDERVFEKVNGMLYRSQIRAAIEDSDEADEVVRRLKKGELKAFRFRESV